MEARNSDFFYNLLMTGQTELYWQKVQGSHLSKEFKDLAEKLFSYDPNGRPTIDEIRQHPWMNMTDAIPFEQVRREIQMEISSKKHIAEEATILKPAKVLHRAKVLQ